MFLKCFECAENVSLKHFKSIRHSFPHVCLYNHLCIYVQIFVHVPENLVFEAAGGLQFITLHA